MTPDRLPTVTEHRIAQLFASVLGGAGILLLVAFEWRGLRLCPHLWDGSRISALDLANSCLAIGVLSGILCVVIRHLAEWLYWALANDPVKPADRFEEEDWHSERFRETNANWMHYDPNAGHEMKVGYNKRISGT
jgi:hypothetical protein